jgi:DNA-binding winged helix-turn-helix (wHTH) protein/Tfp pilus assembly protein PilF
MPLPQVTKGVVRFGVYEADFRTGELRRSGVKVRVQDLPFRALSVLVERPGEIVSREELRQALWPEGVFVEFDQGISSAIRRLREALGDSADNPIFVQTVERRGYRWIAPIHPPELVPEEKIGLRGKEGEKVPAEAQSPATASAWGKLVFVLPIFVLLFAVLLFAVWILRFRGASTKPGTAASANGPHHTVDPEAQDYYLKGRFYWNQRTPESLNLALDSFTQAIVHDPNYADAYVGLADCYNLLREYTAMPASEAYPRAFAAAKKAVQLDEHSSEAHASLAFVSFYGMWDAGTADKEFRRALQLDPNNAKAHHWYATFLQNVRRFDESLTEIDRAQSLDPNSASILADKGILLWIAGRHEEALKLLRQLEQADPNSVSVHRYLNTIYLEMGEYPAYLVEMKQERLLLHDASLLSIEQAAEKGFAARGRTGMLQAQAEQENKFYVEGKRSPYYAARSYARLGNTQEALKYLEACYERHAEESINAAVDPAFENLHSVPAFQQLLAKIGLPPVE